VRAMFDGHETLCAAGAAIHFWAFASFARRDSGDCDIALPSADNATIVYRCDALECVDVTSFFTVPRDGADGVEVLPLPPLVTTVVSAAMQPGRNKTLVITLQQQSNDGACYVVPRVAAAAFDKSAPLAAALLQKGLSEEQIVHDNWTALMSLPLEAVVAMLALQLADSMKPALETYATHDVVKVTPSSTLSCELWCRVVMRFTNGEKGRRILGAADVRDALVALSAQATTADACYWWCGAICNLAFDEANRALFGTAEVRDALLAVQPQATTAAACFCWCGTVNILALDDANKQLLGTTGVRDALVAVHPQATTADACMAWCGAVNNIVLNSASNARLFGSAAVRGALVALSTQATTAMTCESWCDAICTLTDPNNANQQLLGTAEMRDALVAMRPQVTTADACGAWCGVICNLCFTSPDVASVATRNNMQLLRVAAVQNAHAAMKDLAATDEYAKRRWDSAALALRDDEAKS
jgi:hypothetical protein